MPNTAYCLTTEHGRAQSYAHGEQGAFLAAEVEKALAEQETAIASDVEAAIDKELNNLNPVELNSDSLLQEFSLFRQELGKHDSKQFEPLIAAYSEERQMLVGNIELLIALVEQIKVLVGIQPETMEYL